MSWRDRQCDGHAFCDGCGIDLSNLHELKRDCQPEKRSYQPNICCVPSEVESWKLQAASPSSACEFRVSHCRSSFGPRASPASFSETPRYFLSVLPVHIQAISSSDEQSMATVASSSAKVAIANERDVYGLSGDIKKDLLNYLDNIMFGALVISLPSAHFGGTGRKI